LKAGWAGEERSSHGRGSQTKNMAFSCKQKSLVAFFLLGFCPHKARNTSNGQKHLLFQIEFFKALQSLEFCTQKSLSLNTKKIEKTDWRILKKHI